ncbi:hypothetical protein TNCV_4851121 [Trichonephila clavipes]|nr:hypothetical protein TNCV_4851121 [Trichonephila clavipes]
MENTTFAMPSITDSHDMGLRTVLTVQTPKRKRLFNAYSENIQPTQSKKSKNREQRNKELHALFEALIDYEDD